MGETILATNGKKVNPTSNGSNAHHDSHIAPDTMLYSTHGSSHSITYNVLSLAWGREELEKHWLFATHDTVKLHNMSRKMGIKLSYPCCSPNVEPIPLDESPLYSGGLRLCVRIVDVYWECLEVLLYMVKNKAHVVQHTHVTNTCNQCNNKREFGLNCCCFWLRIFDKIVYVILFLPRGWRVLGLWNARSTFIAFQRRTPISRLSTFDFGLQFHFVKTCL